MEGVSVFETVLAICLGLGLAAGSGFRVFVPPLVLAVAQKLGAPLTDAYPQWVGSWPVIGALALATVVEIGAYYVPWVDNALDTIASPLAVIAGTLLTAGALGGDVHPAFKWGMGVVAGGSAAGLTQAATVLTRATSTATTGGLTNFLVSSVEGVLALVMSFVALIIAPVAVLLLMVIIYWFFRLVFRRRRQKRVAATT